jgi:hypothetical protein
MDQSNERKTGMDNQLTANFIGRLRQVNSPMIGFNYGGIRRHALVEEIREPQGTVLCSLLPSDPKYFERTTYYRQFTFAQMENPEIY